MGTDGEKIREAIALLTEAALTSRGAETSSITVEALSDRYSREVARHQRSAVDKERIRKTLVKYLGKRPVLSLTTEDIEAYRDERRERKTRLGKLASPASLNREISQLRASLNWAVKQRLIKYNPIALVSLEPEENVRRTKVRSEEDLMAIIGQLDTLTMRVLILMLIDCGCRRMEAVTLRWSQVFFDRKRAELWKAKATTKPRVFRLSERVMEGLRELQKGKKGAYVFASPRDKKRHISPSWALVQLQRAVEAAGVEAAPGENFTLHSFRHSFAYRSRVRDMLPEKMVMAQGGWSTRSAFDRYGIGDDVELDEMYKVADKNIASESDALREQRKSDRLLQVRQAAELKSLSDKRQGEK